MTKSFYEKIFEGTKKEREETFDALGIQIMNERGEYRDLYDILQELSEKWQLLSKEERGV